jgi:hypothetical protein
MTRELSITRITVRGRAVYGCDRCKAIGWGDNCSFEVISSEAVDEILPGVAYMPAGWASFLPEPGQKDSVSFRCPDCL